MEYSYRFRIYPTPEQETLMQKTFGCCRFVFNHFLAERIELYRETGKSTSEYQQSKSLTKLKKSLEWLREVDATALQSSLHDLEMS